MPNAESPISAALRQFEAAEANLKKLERIFSEMRELLGSGPSFGSDGRYEDKVRAYLEVLSQLPAIDGWKPSAVPMDYDEVGQSRLDAMEVGEISAQVSVERAIEEPGRELAHYRFQLNRARRQLVRRALEEQIAAIDDHLRKLTRTATSRAPANRAVVGRRWEQLKQAVSGLETLLGASFKRPNRWSDLRRHLAFGVKQDLQDIIRLDWPEVKAGLMAGMYSDDEPVPVTASDLGILASAQPQGPLVTELHWDRLNQESFERLMFLLFSSSHGYENTEWLMHTNAPDRGRDLSTFRVSTDVIGGARRERVLVQCKHWRTRSVGASDVATLREQMAAWEAPKVDVLVIATTGRFSADAVTLIEKNNAGDRALRIEMLPESALERLLAQRPDLIAQFRLR